MSLLTFTDFQAPLLCSRWNTIWYIGIICHSCALSTNSIPRYPRKHSDAQIWLSLLESVLKNRLQTLVRFNQLVISCSSYCLLCLLFITWANCITCNWPILMAYRS